MANKMTNRKALEYVVNRYHDELPADVASKLKTMITALDHKANPATRKPTKTQEENAILRDHIMDYLRENPNLLVTCTDLGKHVPVLDGLNNQKIAALMKGLVDSRLVVKVVEKGKSLFQLAADDADSEDMGE